MLRLPDVLAGRLAFSGGARGQAIMETLALFSLAQFPLDLALTDGYVYHILRLRNLKLIVWSNVEPSKAFTHFAQLLSKVRGLGVAWCEQWDCGCCLCQLR
jgi:hypothetical protein